MFTYLLVHSCLASYVNGFYWVKNYCMYHLPFPLRTTFDLRVPLTSVVCMHLYGQIRCCALIFFVNANLNTSGRCRDMVPITRCKGAINSLLAIFITIPKCFLIFAVEYALNISRRRMGRKTDIWTLQTLPKMWECMEAIIRNDHYRSLVNIFWWHCKPMHLMSDKCVIQQPRIRYHWCENISQNVWFCPHYPSINSGSLFI